MRARSYRREDELRIGGIFSLTGYLSWSGKYKRKAAELKVEMINETGGVNGRPLRLIAYDDQSSAEQAGAIAEALIFRHRVVAMVGTGSLPVSRAVATVANRYRTSVFVNSGYAIDPLKDAFVFNTTHKTEYAVACSFQYFLEKGINRLALLMPVGPLGELGSWLARRLGARMGIRIVGEERFDVASPNVTSQLRRLADLKPLALFSFVTGQPAASVSAAMAGLRLDLPLLVSHGNANPRFLKLVSQTPVQLIVPSGKTMVLDAIAENDPCRDVVVDFNKRHLRRYGEPANYYSAELADALDLVVEGLKRTGDADPEKLRDAAESIRNFGGMQGVYDLSPIDHYGTRIEQIVLLTVKDGMWNFAKAFSSISLFEDFHGNRKTGLIRKVADLLSVPSCDDVVPFQGLPSGDLVAARTGLNCTDLNVDLYFVTKLYWQQKRELIRAVAEGDAHSARETLFRLLTIILLQHFDDVERMKLAALELFLALFDSAIDQGVDVEELLRMRQRFTGEWEGVKDHETICLWIVRVLDAIQRALSLMRAEKKGGRLLKKVKDVIETHLSEEMTVGYVARRVGLSPSRLIHRMRSEYNLTVATCIAEARIKKAKRLLRNTDMPISAVGHEVGYGDQSYFSRTFRKHVGCTPKEYRNLSL